MSQHSPLVIHITDPHRAEMARQWLFGGGVIFAEYSIGDRPSRFVCHPQDHDDGDTVEEVAARYADDGAVHLLNEEASNGDG